MGLNPDKERQIISVSWQRGSRVTLNSNNCHLVAHMHLLASDPVPMARECPTMLARDQRPNLDHMGHIGAQLRPNLQ